MALLSIAVEILSGRIGGLDHLLSRGDPALNANDLVSRDGVKVSLGDRGEDNRERRSSSIFQGATRDKRGNMSGE